MHSWWGHPEETISLSSSRYAEQTRTSVFFTEGIGQSDQTQLWKETVPVPGKTEVSAILYKSLVRL